MLLSKVNVVAPLPVAAFEMTRVVLAMETTVVFAGMYVPDTDWPAAIRILDVPSVNVVLVAAVADAVKTPTLVIDGEPKVPGNTPYKTGVLTVESMYCKFCPGWATRLFVALPVESYPMSNCHKLFALDVKSLKEYAVGPKPLPSSLSVCHCSKPAE